MPLVARRTCSVNIQNAPATARAARVVWLLSGAQDRPCGPTPGAVQSRVLCLPLPGPGALTPPAVSEIRLFRCCKGQVRCYTLATGASIGHPRLGEPLATSPWTPGVKVPAWLGFTGRPPGHCPLPRWRALALPRGTQMLPRHWHRDPTGTDRDSEAGSTRAGPSGLDLLATASRH
jgi:hypothetical protein